MRQELRAWKRRACNAIDRGNSANIEFDSIAIPPEIQKDIKIKLENCKTTDEVKALFENLKIQATSPADVAAILEGIKLGVEALKVSE